MLRWRQRFRAQTCDAVAASGSPAEAGGSPFSAATELAQAERAAAAVALCTENTAPGSASEVKSARAAAP
jgi:hypothetical protein